MHRIFKVQVRQEPAIEKVEEKGIEVHAEPTLDVNSKSLIVNREEPETNSKRSTINDERSTNEKDPNEMTDKELDAEIARLETLEKQGISGQSSLSPDSPFASVNKKPLKVDNIGRNDPSPCGSGLKWKKCGLINAPQHKA